ncbi:MAG: hypothetical protein FWF83_02985 [Clostridiales bacterium]|nr:hypothetical protein [Clostridiales bacterium]
MNIHELYESKKSSPDEMIKAVKSGDVIMTGGNPVLLHKALYDHRENFRDVKMYAQFNLNGTSKDYIHSPEMMDRVSFTCTTLALHSITNIWPTDNFDQISLSFSGMERLIEKIRPNIVLLSAYPMDEDGYLNLGCNHGCTRVAIDNGARVFAQINENMYDAYTDYYRVHISEVEGLFESVNPKENPVPMNRDIGEIDKQLAAHIVERIPNGATIQLGAGGASNAVGAFLKGHRDLGVHAETIMDSMMDLIDTGVINNSKKPIFPGKSVIGFISGTPAMMSYVHNNKDVILKRLSWVNDPHVIGQLPNVVSMNAVLAADLRGQVCSESLALGNTGGIGGQLDFTEGARRSPGGQSFLVMHSSVTTRDGEKVSKITLSLPRGSVVTNPASEVMNIVTEYGVAEMWRKSAKERAQNLIRIADPEFRETLTFEAKKAGLI